MVGRFSKAFVVAAVRFVSVLRLALGDAGGVTVNEWLAVLGAIWLFSTRFSETWFVGKSLGHGLEMWRCCERRAG